jgi:hypothetical protein
LFVLAWPKRPAKKKGTEVPLIGTLSVSVFEKAPLVPWRKTTSPPFAAETLDSLMFIPCEEAAPDGLVIRIRHGEGTQDTNRAPGLLLLLICSSTFISYLLAAATRPFNDGDNHLQQKSNERVTLVMRLKQEAKTGID